MATLLCLFMVFPLTGQGAEKPAIPDGVRVGAASTEFEADDSMIIAGGITAGKAKGQEGKLRATAVVLEKQPFGKLVLVACTLRVRSAQRIVLLGRNRANERRGGRLAQRPPTFDPVPARELRPRPRATQSRAESAFARRTPLA